MFPAVLWLISLSDYTVDNHTGRLAAVWICTASEVTLCEISKN